MTIATRTGTLATAAARVGAYARQRRWIDRRIAELDPETDHVEIVRLSTVYGVNDMQLHWAYAVNSTAAGVQPGVLDAVWRDGTGTYGAQPLKRVDDSGDHMMTWFEHGPDAAATRRSVDMINRYHAHFAREYPQGFSDIDDYVYILCLNATAVDSSMRSLGLPGYSEKQERATHLFWSRLAEQFVSVLDDRPVTDLATFPASYPAMVELVRDYQARPWPRHEPGHRATTSVVEVFAATWFPRPLRFLGRALVTAFLSPATLRVHSIAPPPAPLARLARATMKAMVLVATHVTPDPLESLPDRRRRLAATGQGEASPVDTAVHRSIRDAPAGSGCPHLAVLR